jgi:hypothetical protein
MLATLVGLSMLLAVAGGLATLAGVLLARRLRARQARRHPQQAATRAHSQQARRLAAEWPLLAQTLGLGYRDQWTRQHRFPPGEFAADNQGVTAIEDVPRPVELRWRLGNWSGGILLAGCDSRYGLVERDA